MISFEDLTLRDVGGGINVGRGKGYGQDQVIAEVQD